MNDLTPMIALGVEWGGRMVSQNPRRVELRVLGGRITRVSLCGLRVVRPGGGSEVKRPSGREWGSALLSLTRKSNGYCPRPRPFHKAALSAVAPARPPRVLSSRYPPRNAWCSERMFSGTLSPPKTWREATNSASYGSCGRKRHCAADRGSAPVSAGWAAPPAP